MKSSKRWRCYKHLPVATILPIMAFSSLALAFDIDGATQAYLSARSSEQVANAEGYVNTGYLLMLGETLLAVLITWLLLGTGWSRRWRDIAQRKLGKPFLQAFIYFPIYVSVTALFLFPLNWFSGFVTEHRYGLATQSFPAWLAEHLIGIALEIVLLTLFAALLYMLIRRTPERWWAWASGMAILSMMFVILISPVFIDPLFNDYRPMDEGPLKEKILSIARANGMQVDDVKQVDASRQTNRVSANVSGLFGTARIALNDNLLLRADADSVEAVMAHEIGHYVLNHIGKMMLALLPILIGLFLLTHVIVNACLRRWGKQWGINAINDYAAFPLLIATFTVLASLATPVFNRVVYMQEYEADLFAINATQNPDAWANVALLTAEYRKLKPPAWEEDWLNHHPSPYMRIYMAMRWKAENLSPEEPVAP